MKWKLFCLTVGLVVALTFPAFTQGQRYVLLGDFEGISAPTWPAGWATDDGNGDGNTWVMRTHGGAQNGLCVRYLSHATNAADDWFFTPAVALTSGTQYTLYFRLRVTSPANSHRLTVWTGSAQTVASMTTQILDLANIVNSAIEQTSATYTAAATGDYCFGFHCTSDPNRFALYVDDIIVARRASALEIRFELDKAFYNGGANTYGAREPIDCLVYVKNVGASPLKVNGLLSVGHDNDPDVAVSFLVADPSGQAVPFEMLYQTAFPREEDFQPLQPGEAVCSYYDLNDGSFDFTTSGTYTIRAVYKNHHESQDSSAWLGRLVSDPVELTIK